MIYSKKYIAYDFGFLKEITELIITNLTELNDSLASRVIVKDPDLCMKLICQSKLTFSLIGNDNLLAKAMQISEMLEVKSTLEENQRLIDSFQITCSQEIIQLYARLKHYENYLAKHPK